MLFVVDTFGLKNYKIDKFLFTLLGMNLDLMFYFIL